MKILLYCFYLTLLSGCATKYMLPGNRFLTPETQGKTFESQFEIQQASASRGTIDLSNASTDNALLYSDEKKAGYLYSTSLLEQIDFFWSTVASGNSMLGGKYQILGSSRTAKGAGHKIAVSVAFGGNKHKIEGSDTIEFNLKGKEFSLIHGFRINENVLLYDALSYSQYSFDGTVTSSDPLYSGLKFQYDNTLIGLYGGTELSLGPLFGKLELGYQTIRTTSTPVRSWYVMGYSIGISW